METKKTNNLGIKFIFFITIILITLSLYTFASRKRVGAECRDGTISYSTGCGTCSHHHGVKYWKYEYWWNRNSND